MNEVIEQMDEKTIVLLGTILGGLLSAGTGVVIDYFREKNKQKSARNLLITAICDDLNNSVQLYNQINTEWLERKMIIFQTIRELKLSREVYQNNKDWIVIFEDGEIRKQIFYYYAKSSHLLDILEFNQNRKYSIENQHNELKLSLMLQQKDLVETEAEKKAFDLMKKENHEYTQLDNVISSQISKLIALKSEAIEISEKLKSL